MISITVKVERVAAYPLTSTNMIKIMTGLTSGLKKRLIMTAKAVMVMVEANHHIAA
ncbi:hypothetical protein D3C80_1858550 [compost metagenome]